MDPKEKSLGGGIGDISSIFQRRRVYDKCSLGKYQEYQTYVAGNWGECSEDLHSLVQSCAEARVAHICRSTGRQELEHLHVNRGCMQTMDDPNLSLIM